ncbi:MAG: CREG family protein [Magnetovibrio sp.]|nr:CREG family protein [Magnetovibrio sp.]
MNRTKRPEAPYKAAHAARLIARATLKGALATNRKAAKGTKQNHPYVSKVGVAVDFDGAPLFLFSTLAAHTQDLLADERASVLLEAPTSAVNPLEGARCSLIGRVQQLSGDKADLARALYLIRHPGAAMYAGFGDFSMWRMQVEKVHYVGGFGRAKWAKAKDYLLSCPNLTKTSGRIVEDLTHKWAEDLSLVFKAKTGRSARGWKVLAIDGDGLILSGSKGAQQRLDFASPARDGRGWRTRFRTLVKCAKTTTKS